MLHHCRTTILHFLVTDDVALTFWGSIRNGHSLLERVWEQTSCRGAKCLPLLIREEPMSPLGETNPSSEHLKEHDP